MEDVALTDETIKAVKSFIRDWWDSDMVEVDSDDHNAYASFTKKFTQGDIDIFLDFYLVYYPTFFERQVEYWTLDSYEVQDCQAFRGKTEVNVTNWEILNKS